MQRRNNVYIMKCQKNPSNKENYITKENREKLEQALKKYNPK